MTARAAGANFTRKARVRASRKSRPKSGYPRCPTCSIIECTRTPVQAEPAQATRPPRFGKGRKGG